MLAYRYLTDVDTSAFCHKVTRALSQGWELYGDPSYAYDAAAGAMRCGQAVVKRVERDYDPEMKLGEL
ncbi:DUF1737 domain-containing protein [Amaricoccus sp.]|uniref:DUF1737 domain-containing protein n=1 Tax=Amaricoccus sp. TaxID=1872485 RepID=UPI0026158342|nr:DUF1737 domain-containing protein [uncultured Amaricoccus sp.]